MCALLLGFADVIGARKYTLGHYMAFAEQMGAKAKWLNEQAAKSSEDQSEGDVWSAQRVQLCLYAAAHSSTQAPSKAKAKAPAVKPAAKKRAPASKKDASDNEVATKKSDRDEGPAMATRKRRRVSAQ